MQKGTKDQVRKGVIQIKKENKKIIKKNKNKNKKKNKKRSENWVASQ